MTFIPTSACFGTGGAVTASTDETVANKGAVNFASSPNNNGVTTTQGYLTSKLNALNVGSTPASNAGTT